MAERIVEFPCPVDIVHADGRAVRVEALWRRCWLFPELFVPHFLDSATGEWRRADVHRLDPGADWPAEDPLLRGRILLSGTGFDALIEACMADGALPDASRLDNRASMPSSNGPIAIGFCDHQSDKDGRSVRTYLMSMHERDSAAHADFGRTWAEAQALEGVVPEPDPDRSGPPPRI